MVNIMESDWDYLRRRKQLRCSTKNKIHKRTVANYQDAWTIQPAKYLEKLCVGEYRGFKVCLF